MHQNQHSLHRQPAVRKLVGFQVLGLGALFSMLFFLDLWGLAIRHSNAHGAEEELRAMSSATPIEVYTSSSGEAKPFLLTLCTSVMNDVPYIVEWIEYMSLQGVDRFVIYDDDSSDNVTLLNKLYASRSGHSQVIVLPKIGEHGEQTPSLQHCLENYGNSTVWMLISDTDEFLFSPGFGTLKNMLLQGVPAEEAATGTPVSQIEVDCTRFGTGGQRQRFAQRLREHADGTVTYECPHGLELILSHTLRGPDHRRGDEEARLYKELHSSVRGCGGEVGWDVCSNGPGKSMFRPEHTRRAGVHYSYLDDNDRVERSDANWAWCNHYYLRSKEDAALKAKQWDKEDPLRMFEETDVQFWSRVADTSLRDKWEPLVVERMSKLSSSPRKVIREEVNRYG